MPTLYMQIFGIIMLLFVIIGMSYDFIGGKKLEYTLKDRKMRNSSGFYIGAALNAIFVDITTSAQFAKCSVQRRASHILMMWGFIISIVILFIEIYFIHFAAILSIYNPLQMILVIAWIMVIAGALWFMPQRANVRVDGDPVYRLRRADIFVVNVIAYAILGIALEAAVMSGSVILSEVLLTVFMCSITLLFALIPWTKFPHMFYKAGLIIQDKMEMGKVESRLPGD
ncbi:MAG: hypothetical protein QXY52_05715 [Conexivisphaerales archaeon]